MSDHNVRIVLVAGARPNFMKIAPIHAELSRLDRVQPIVVHTGQHYDRRMSQVFLDQLGLPEPDLNLEVGSDTHARQTAAIMVAFESALTRFAPDVVLVVGDVNSTLACALVAQRAGIDVVHVEAGLRSGDRSMPEEINRVLTDQISDWLYTSCEDAAPNLLAEGIDAARIAFVGNVMIDSLIRHLPAAEADDVLTRLGLEAGRYALCTLHRPSNVDDPDVLAGILGELARLSAELPVLLPVHPRTRARLAPFDDLIEAAGDLRVVEPEGYHSFLRLTRDARLVITDSGGIQEETTYLRVPCVTVRESTERPITIYEGTNQLVGTDPSRIRQGIERAVVHPGVETPMPRLWDGKASSRIAGHLRERYVANVSRVG